MLKPKIIKELGMTYLTENSKQKTRVVIYECENCLNHFKASLYKYNLKKTPCCKKCSQLKKYSNREKYIKLDRQQVFTQKYLSECFKYDFNSGKLFWKERPISHFNNNKKVAFFANRFKGKEVGTKKNTKRSNTTYLVTRVNGFYAPIHRLIWIMHNGSIDDAMQIDHIDNNGLNNKIENLRLVSSSINQRNKPLQKNNKTRVNGVNWHKSAKKWQARITDLNGKRIDLGRFDNFNDAVKARKSYEKEYGYLQ